MSVNQLNPCVEESYIYFGKRFEFFIWHENFTQYRKKRLERGIDPQKIAKDLDYFREIKIGETASYYYRQENLRYKDGIYISRRVKFMGTKDERLFIESQIRTRYALNGNMGHHGNDYFWCLNTNTIKGAERKFFSYVADAFQQLSLMTGKNYECEYQVMRPE